MNTESDSSLLDAGLRAFAKNDFPEAARILEICAMAGEARAQILLARMYYAGNGVQADRNKYIYWLEKAAAGGNKTARAKLKRLKQVITPKE